MIIEYEKSLVENYIPYLVPDVKNIKFASGDSAFYWDSKHIKYPSVLVTREDNDPTICAKYRLNNNKTQTLNWYWPFEQQYTIRVLVEKQSEAIVRRNNMRVFYAKDPYVSFLLENTPIHIGMRLLSMSVISDRDNYDEKGAKRVVSMRVQSTLVISGEITEIPLIQEVRVFIKDGVTKAQALYEI